MKSTTITHEEFITKFNNKIKKATFEIVSPYLCDMCEILVLTKFGICKTTPDMILCGKTPTIKSAIDKTEFFKNKINIKFPNISYRITGDYIAGGGVNKILVEDVYGEHLIYQHSLLQGSSPSVVSACNKTEYMINKFKEKHDNLYDYPKFEYLGNKIESSILCKIHGSFPQTPSTHLEGKGCPKCGADLKGYSKKHFIKRAKGKNCCLYIIECFNDTETFYKVGITKKTTMKRFSTKVSMPYSYNILYEYTENAECIWELEQTYKKKLKDISYSPLIHFAGHTECYKLNPLSI